MPNRVPRRRPAFERLINAPYEQLRAAVPDGRLQLVFGIDGWVASVWQGRARHPAASGQGATQEEALRALAAELGVEGWTP